MDKRWLITGAGSGLGRALASAALARGDRVAVTLRGGADLPGALSYRLDLRDGPAVEQVVAAADRELGGIDVLVNNAGYGLVGAIEETSDAELRDQFEINFFAALTAMRTVLPMMRKRRSGHIVNISSVSGLVGWPSLGIYSASKFALEGVSETLALEVAPLGIKVSLVEPGALRTDFSTRSRRHTERMITDYAQTAGESRRLLTDHAGKEPGDPVEAAAAILKLVDAKDPPLRLLLGADALTYAEKKLDQQRAEIEAWKAVTLGIDFKP